MPSQPVTTLRNLLGDWRVGAPIHAPGLPRHELRSVSTAGGLAIWLAGPKGDVRIDVFPLGTLDQDTAQRAVARTESLGLSYRSLGHADSTLGRALCEAVARQITQHESAVIAELRRNQGHKRVRNVLGGPVLTLMGPADAPFWGLDPYVGCTIGCRFCYAQGRAQSWRQLVGLPGAQWGSWVDVREDAPDVLADELLAASRLPIKFSPIVSDPYQALERTRRITRRCLEVLAAQDWPAPVVVLTRSTTVLDDAALLGRLRNVWVGMSVPTLDQSLVDALEPAASPVAARLETLAALRDKGLRTFAVVQPVLPGDPQALASALASVVASASVDSLAGVYGAKQAFEGGPVADRLALARDSAWRQRQLEDTVSALRSAGVDVWRGELPPGCL
ncbi:MAG: hypothetical protein KC502_13910 [Myxococcales bacterium]|nr:hypothetical protein [Myxococcales bacterium]